MYIADFLNHRIRKVTVSTGIITTFAGTGTGGYLGDTGQATSVKLNYPLRVAVDASGTAQLFYFLILKSQCFCYRQRVHCGYLQQSHPQGDGTNSVGNTNEYTNNYPDLHPIEIPDKRAITIPHSSPNELPKSESEHDVYHLHISGFGICYL